MILTLIAAAASTFAPASILTFADEQRARTLAMPTDYACDPQFSALHARLGVPRIHADHLGRCLDRCKHRAGGVVLLESLAVVPHVHCDAAAQPDSARRLALDARRGGTNSLGANNLEPHVRSSTRLRSIARSL